MEVDERLPSWSLKMTVHLGNIPRLSFVYLLLTSMARPLVVSALYAVAVPNIPNKFYEWYDVWENTLSCACCMKCIIKVISRWTVSCCLSCFFFRLPTCRHRSWFSSFSWSKSRWVCFCCSDNSCSNFANWSLSIDDWTLIQICK